jgi:hypothetical protein
MGKKQARAKKRTHSRKMKLAEGIQLVEYEITYDPIEQDYIINAAQEMKLPPCHVLRQ